jgi:hypothetical protein
LNMGPDKDIIFCFVLKTSWVLNWISTMTLVGFCFVLKTIWVLNRISTKTLVLNSVSLII